MYWWYSFVALIKHFSVLTVGSHLLHAFGILWVTLEISHYFFSQYTEIVKENWWGFFIAGGVLGFCRGWPRLAVRSVISDTDSAIEIRVGDLFKQQGAVVVAAPTSFDTTMEDGTIDIKSAQGQYTHLYCDSMENLDIQIITSLEGIEFEERDAADKPYGIQRRYPVGTVASVVFSNKQAYFVAIGTLNAHRTASATRNELLDALPALWENIRTRGSMGPISVPILGSGFSRLNATREELVREIVKSFVAATHAGQFCEQLRIMISPKDFREMNIDLNALGRFLEHECKYGSAPRPANAATVGTPM